MKVRCRFDNYADVRLQSTCNCIVKLVAAVIQNSGLVFCSIFRKEKHKHTGFIILVSSRKRYSYPPNEKRVHMDLSYSASLAEAFTRWDTLGHALQRHRGERGLDE